MEYRAIIKSDRMGHGLFNFGKKNTSSTSFGSGKGTARKNHKYIARQWIQGKWRYFYTQAQLLAAQKKQNGLNAGKKTEDTTETSTKKLKVPVATKTGESSGKSFADALAIAKANANKPGAVAATSSKSKKGKGSSKSSSSSSNKTTLKTTGNSSSSSDRIVLRGGPLDNTGSSKSSSSGSAKTSPVLANDPYEQGSVTLKGSNSQTSTVETAIKSKEEAQVEKMVEELQKSSEKGKEAVIKTIGQMAPELSNISAETVDTGKNYVTTILNSLKQKISNIGSKASAGLKAVSNWLKSLTNKR